MARPKINIEKEPEIKPNIHIGPNPPQPLTTYCKYNCTNPSCNHKYECIAIGNSLVLWQVLCAKCKSTMRLETYKK